MINIYIYKYIYVLSQGSVMPSVSASWLCLQKFPNNTCKDQSVERGIETWKALCEMLSCFPYFCCEWCVLIARSRHLNGRNWVCPMTFNSRPNSYHYFEDGNAHN